MLGSEPQMSVNDGISTYGNITSFAESTLAQGLLYVGTDDGNLQVSRDDGATWTNVADRIPGLPERTYVSRVEPSHHVEGRVYASFDGHRNADYAAYVYVSEDYGQNWSPNHRRAARRLVGERRNRASPRPPTCSSWATRRACSCRSTGAGSGVQLKNNLPTVPVDDILVHPRDNDLLVGTHGRSFYILADVTPLEQLSESMLAEAGRVFPQARPTIMWAERGDWPFQGATYQAPNPPRGSLIRYYLRDEWEAPMAVEDDEGGGNGNGDGSEDEDSGQDADEGDDGDERSDADSGQDADDADAAFALTITDSDGNHVRTLEAPSEPGINEVVWDWRFDPPYEADGQQGGGGGWPLRRRRAPGPDRAARCVHGEHGRRRGDLLHDRGDPG